MQGAAHLAEPPQCEQGDLGPGEQPGPEYLIAYLLELLGALGAGLFEDGVYGLDCIGLGGGRLAHPDAPPDLLRYIVVVEAGVARQQPGALDLYGNLAYGVIKEGAPQVGIVWDAGGQRLLRLGLGAAYRIVGPHHYALLDGRDQGRELLVLPQQKLGGAGVYGDAGALVLYLGDVGPLGYAAQDGGHYVLAGRLLLAVLSLHRTRAG